MYPTDQDSSYPVHEPPDIERSSPPLISRMSRWLRHHYLESLLAAALATAVIFYLNPFPLLDLLVDRLPFTLAYQLTRLGKWLAYGGGSQLISGLFLVTAAAVVVVRWRRQFIDNDHLWSSRCPNCQSADLKRIRRTWPDRLVSRFVIPVRRYLCADCQWRGRKADRSRV